MNLKHTAERKDGVIPVKYRELMSVAVALTTQCAYCIESPINNAVQAGASREEIAETVFIAAALRAGAPSTPGCWPCGCSKRLVTLPDEATQGEWAPTGQARVRFRPDHPLIFCGDFAAN